MPPTSPFPLVPLTRDLADADTLGQIQRTLSLALGPDVTLHPDADGAHVIHIARDRYAFSGPLPTRPRDRALFLNSLRSALRRARALERLASGSRRAYREAARLRDELDDQRPQRPTRRSLPMVELGQQMARVAPHGTTVLLLGESGTGKEVLARELHSRSRRRRGPFVAINCGSLPATLLESELFGHARGAFTGATGPKRGLMEEANEGTLFLDEIGDMPLASQVALLRALEQREIRPIGGTKNIRIDIRVIAATHHDLAARVRDGTFREDLYYRLSAFPLRVPALRERAGDFAPLVDELIGDLCRTMGRPPPAIPREVVWELCRRPWPGNVRELRNVLERALVLSDDVLTLSENQRPRAPSLSLTLDDAIRAHLEATLRETKGRVYGPLGAAERLGLRPSTLQSKLKRLGVDAGAFRRRGRR